MYVGFPEVGRFKPLPIAAAKHRFALFADEHEPVFLQIEFPDNPLNRIDQVPEAALPVGDRVFPLTNRFDHLFEAGGQGIDFFIYLFRRFDLILAIGKFARVCDQFRNRSHQFS